MKSEIEVSLSGLEKDLNGLHVELASYLQLLREERAKNEEVKVRRESNVKQSTIRSKVIPSPVKSAVFVDDAPIPGLRSKIKSKKENA